MSLYKFDDSPPEGLRNIDLSVRLFKIMQETFVYQRSTPEYLKDRGWEFVRELSDVTLRRGQARIWRSGTGLELPQRTALKVQRLLDSGMNIEDIGIRKLREGLYLIKIQNQL